MFQVWCFVTETYTSCSASQLGGRERTGSLVQGGIRDNGGGGGDVVPDGW